MRRYIGPKCVMLLLFLLGGLFYAWGLYRQGELSPSIIEDYREGHPFAAVILFIVLYASSMIAVLPTLPLNLAGGYFWGGVVGGIYSATAVTLGGWTSFCIARWLIGQPLAKRFENRWGEKVKRAFERSGWKFIAFARLNPIIPTGPLNYLLGLTSISHSWRGVILRCSGEHHISVKCESPSVEQLRIKLDLLITSEGLRCSVMV